MQKIQWNSSNGQLHRLSIDFLWKWSIMDQNYANGNPFFSVAKKFSEVSRVCHMKVDVLPFLKMWWFLWYHLLNRSYCCSKSGQIRRFFLKVATSKKIDTRSKNKFKTNPPEKSFKIGFWNFQENLFWEKNLSEYLFFWMTPLSKKILRFDPTLSSNNSGLKNDSIKTTTFSETAGRQLSSYPDFSTSVTSKKFNKKLYKYTLWKVLQSIFMLVYHDNSFNIASRVEWRKTKLSPYSNVSRVISFWKIDSQNVCSYWSPFVRRLKTKFLLNRRAEGCVY